MTLSVDSIIWNVRTTSNIQIASRNFGNFSTRRTRRGSASTLRHPPAPSGTLRELEFRNWKVWNFTTQELPRWFIIQKVWFRIYNWTIYGPAERCSSRCWHPFAGVDAVERCRSEGSRTLLHFQLVCDASVAYENREFHMSESWADYRSSAPLQVTCYKWQSFKLKLFNSWCVPNV